MDAVPFGLREMADVSGVQAVRRDGGSSGKKIRDDRRREMPTPSHVPCRPVTRMTAACFSSPSTITRQRTCVHQPFEKTASTDRRFLLSGVANSTPASGDPPRLSANATSYVANGLK